MSGITLWPPTNPITILACTIWMEARSDGLEGMQAVANVVLNRINHPRWWGHGIASVCLAPEQFSSWNDGSTQIPLVKQAIEKLDPVYLEAIKIAQSAVQDDLVDNTKGADSYFAISIPAPSWAKENEFTVQIGRQRFYRTELPPVDET